MPTRYATLHDKWLCYRDLREFGMSHLDAFLLGFGYWVHFPSRYPEVPADAAIRRVLDHD